MLKFLLRRLLGMIPVLFAAITLTFFLVRLAPGGPFTDEKRYPAETIAQLNRHYGLSDPLPLQYVRYLGRVARGDLGPSMHYRNRSVNDIIAESFPVSLELGCWALLFALAAGICAGAVAALRPNSAVDHATMACAMVGICVPSFVLGPLMILIFALKFGWCNAGGWAVAGDRLLPAICLGAAYAAYIARLSRGGLLEVMPQDYIRTARAKGLSETAVVIRHALKPGLTPVVSFLGPAIAGLLTGSFVVETVFNIPGLGKTFVTAAFNRDYSLVLGFVVFYSVLIVVFNTLADVLLALLDPRIKATEITGRS